MEKQILASILLLCFWSTMHAQYARPQATALFGVAIPTHEFAQAVTEEQAYFGLGAEVTFPFFKDTPLRFGLDGRYFFMGTGDRNVDIMDTLGAFQYNLNSKVSGGMMPFHLRARLDLMNIYNYPVLPYAGGFFGLRIFNITRNFEFDYEDGSDPYTETERTTSTTASFGFELGVHIRVNYFILIDVRYERTYGGWAKYLDASTIQIDEEGYVYYQELNTRTDADLLTIGASIELN